MYFSITGVLYKGATKLIILNWDLETASFDWLLRVVSKFTVCKRFCQISNFYANVAKYAIKVQSEVIGTSSGSCLFGFVHSVYNHFIF